jgi:hypothetical protein
MQIIVQSYLWYGQAQLQLRNVYSNTPKDACGNWMKLANKPVPRRGRASVSVSCVARSSANRRTFEYEIPGKEKQNIRELTKVRSRPSTWLVERIRILHHHLNRDNHTLRRDQMYLQPVVTREHLCLNFLMKGEIDVS